MPIGACNPLSVARLQEEEEEAAKKADDANTQYIKRADAYGNQSAGMTEAGKTLTTATRYVPPGRRGVMDSADDAQKMARAARQVSMTNRPPFGLMVLSSNPVTST